MTMIDTTTPVTNWELEWYTVRGPFKTFTLRVTIDRQRAQRRIMNLRANRGYVPCKTDYSSDLPE